MAKSESHILSKIIIDKKSKNYLLRQLDKIGINEKLLFPGLDGLGRYLQMKYSFGEDELNKKMVEIGDNLTRYWLETHDDATEKD